MTGVRSEGSPLRVMRPTTREGYDLWAEAYDQTANPLVALDRRYAIAHLGPRPGEWILDAGCGTGGHLDALRDAGSRAIGLDFSFGMLQVAARTHCNSRLVIADLAKPLPFVEETFDAILCSLVSEHLGDPGAFFTEAKRILRPEGRIVFTGLHPSWTTSGVEANFEIDGVQYRLGAQEHTISDFIAAVTSAGFFDIAVHDYWVDEQLGSLIPKARRYEAKPLLFVLTAEAGGNGSGGGLRQTL